MQTEEKRAQMRGHGKLSPIEGSRHWETIIQGICTSKTKQKNNTNVSFLFTVTKSYMKTYCIRLGTLTKCRLVRGYDY